MRPPGELYFIEENPDKYAPDTRFMIPPINEEFVIEEGQTYKGAIGPVKDLVKINSQEFITCDESG